MCPQLFDACATCMGGSLVVSFYLLFSYALGSAWTTIWENFVELQTPHVLSRERSSYTKNIEKFKYWTKTSPYQSRNVA